MGSPVTYLHGRPTAAELVSAVAEFLDGAIRDADTLTPQTKFHARVAANALRIVERELTDTTGAEVVAALTQLGYDDEAALAADIRAGRLEDRDAEVGACLRTVVGHRLRVAHPGYEEIG
jgi:hypothetical protein